MNTRESLVSSFTTAAVMFLIALIYIGAVHFGAKVPWKEAWARTGMTLGSPRWWVMASMLFIPFCAYTWLSYRWMPITQADTHSPYHVLLGRGLHSETLIVAFSYGMVSAGLGEELLFRGLIAGAISRRMTLAQANVLQTLIFLAPHLLILFVKPEAAPLMVGVLGLGLSTGWLRIKSGSIGPGVLIHGLANTLVGILAATSA